MVGRKCNKGREFEKGWEWFVNQRAISLNVFLEEI